MTSENWIEIRAGIGGQPTLVEDRSALAALELLRFHPRAIAAIGSQSKREIFGEDLTRVASNRTYEVFASRHGQDLNC